MASICFKSGDRPICYWDDAPEATNLDSLQFLDPDPFLVAASDFWPEIETIEFNDRWLDQLFLQYWISIEALLSLIAALIQAPDYFYGSDRR